MTSLSSVSLSGLVLSTTHFSTENLLLLTLSNLNRKQINDSLGFSLNCRLSLASANF